MKKQTLFYSSLVILFIIGITKSNYLAWSLGWELVSVILLIVFFVLFFYVVISTITTSIIIKEPVGRIRQTFVNAGFVLLALVVYGAFFCYKFRDYDAYGDCLFNPTNAGFYSNLYTRDGGTIVNGKDYFHSASFNKHKDCKINRTGIHLGGDMSCVIECPSGPYFCYIKKVDIDQVEKGRNYEYDRYGNRVYFEYEEYRIEYLIAIYNSTGLYIDDFEDNYSFLYYPNLKKIDRNEYSYRLNGNDIKYLFNDKLAQIVHDDLVDYVSIMDDEEQPSSKVPEVKPQPAPQPAPRPTPQPTPQPARTPVPMQVFKKCWSCMGGGQCNYCYGSGIIYYPTGQQWCSVCGGSGRCNICAGRGGEYVVEYH